jgi:hypothetical protein
VWRVSAPSCASAAGSRQPPLLVCCVRLALQYDYMIKSLKDRMLRLQARHYHPMHRRPHDRTGGGKQHAAGPDGAVAGGATPPVS